MAESFEKILVTGSSGFLGSHIVPALRRGTRAEIIPVTSSDCNLLKPNAVSRLLAGTRPDCVVHLAAKVGGIIANAKYPADFFFENIMINTMFFDACHRTGVKKFLTLMGGCSYPANAVSPISEDQMWNGMPQPESAPYSTAKKMMLIQSDAYRKQHNFNSIVLIPGNVYGEHDNFNEEYSHVIPALIRRFDEAAGKKLPSVTCYGSGCPTRDFVYAGDVAKTIPWFLKNYSSSEPVNISSGTRVTIRELAETTARIIGYKGEILWDTSKPDGQKDKIFDVTRLKSLGLSCDTTLEQGLRKTVKWYKQAKSRKTLRL